MKRHVQRLTIAVAVALVALVGAPALHAQSGGDVAGFYVAEKLLVGSVTLEPGVYLVRSVRGMTSQNVLVVTNVDATKVYASILATPHQFAAHEVAETSRLLYAEGDGTRPNALRTFVAANSSFGYDIVSHAKEARVASAKLGVITAITASR